MGFFKRLFGLEREEEQKSINSKPRLNLAVVYYSSTGTNFQMAQWAADAGREQDAEVRILKVPELASPSLIEGNPAWKAHVDVTKDIPVVTPEDIVWADAIIFSTPTRFGNMASQMKQFLDTTGGIWFNGKTINKAVSAMTSAQNAHGGQEATILSIYTTMHHWGAIVVPPGFTDPSIFAAGGNPYGTSVSVDQNGNMIEKVRDAVIHQTKRVLTVAEHIKKGMQV